MNHRLDTVASTHGAGVKSTRALLARGPGWSVSDVVFRAASERSRFEARHEGIVIAAVTAGNFGYRSSRGRVTLMPGALLLGNADDAFECRYERSLGDRCISFDYTVECFENAVGALSGARKFAFPIHRLPPTPAVVARAAAIEAASTVADAAQFEELALRLAGDVVSTLAGTPQAGVPASSRDEIRIVDALHLIEARYSEPLSVTSLAATVRMSPYHFLRVFRAVAGVTPHQYLVRTRLRRAAVALATSDESIAAIAFTQGFGDLSTFVATFRRMFGLAPRDYRAAERARRRRGVGWDSHEMQRAPGSRRSVRPAKRPP
jgi:AraC-like DNA-binding protein